MNEPRILLIGADFPKSPATAEFGYDAEVVERLKKWGALSGDLRHVQRTAELLRGAYSNPVYAGGERAAASRACPRPARGMWRRR